MIKNTTLKISITALSIVYLICMVNFLPIFLIKNNLIEINKNNEFEENLDPSWPQYPGEFLVDVDYTFWINMANMPGFTAVVYGDLTVSLGTKSYNYHKEGSGIMQGSNTFTLGSTTMEADMSFEFKMAQIRTIWGPPYFITDFFSDNEILRPSLHPLLKLVIRFILPFGQKSFIWP